MRLDELSPAIGSKKSPKRVGRGSGSGHGTTAGRGSKGYNSRSGGGVRPGYEGGQMPIHRRLPKRGFNNKFRKIYAIVNLKDLQLFEQGSVVDEVSLVKKGLVKGKRDGIKILGEGEIKTSLIFKVDKLSNAAIEKINSAGGKIEPVKQRGN